MGTGDCDGAAGWGRDWPVPGGIAPDWPVLLGGQGRDAAVGCLGEGGGMSGLSMEIGSMAE